MIILSVHCGSPNQNVKQRNDTVGRQWFGKIILLQPEKGILEHVEIVETRFQLKKEIYSLKYTPNLVPSQI